MAWHKFILTILHRATSLSHTAPSFYPGCTHICLPHFSSRSSLSLFSGCFLSRIRIHVYLPQLITCRCYASPARSTTRLLSFMDSHIIGAWVHISLERFGPYSLRSGTTIRTTNRTSFLVFLWYSIKPYAPIALTRTLWCLPRRNRVSIVHACASFVTSHRGALTFTGHWPQMYCVVSGAYVPKVVLELERTAYALKVWATCPPGRSSLLRWCTQ